MQAILALSDIVRDLKRSVLNFELISLRVNMFDEDAGIAYSTLFKARSGGTNGITAKVNLSGFIRQVGNLSLSLGYRLMKTVEHISRFKVLSSCSPSFLLVDYILLVNIGLLNMISV